MTARETAAYLRACEEQDLNVTLNTLADQAIEARLSNGARLCDASDFAAWLREVAEAWRKPVFEKVTR